MLTTVSACVVCGGSAPHAPHTTKPTGIPWIGEIPTHWQISRIGLYFTNHKDIARERATELPRLALTLNGVIERSKTDSNGLQPLNFDTYQILHEGELVFKLIDLENVQTSRVGLSPFKIGIVSPAYIIIKSDGRILPKYAEYYFLMMWRNKVFNGLGSSGVRSNLNATDLLRLPIPVLPLSEQKHIASHLDSVTSSIDESVRLIDEQIEDLKAYRRSLITEVVTHGVPGTHDTNEMTDTGIEWISTIPQEWQVQRLKYLIESRISGVWGDLPELTEHTAICLRIADFDYLRLRFKNPDTTQFTIRGYDTNTIQKYRLNKGDILVEKSGGGDKTPVGRAVLFDFEGEYLFANFMDRLRVIHNLIKPSYFLYVWSAMYACQVTRLYFNQTTGIQNLNFNQLFGFESFPVPPLAEQQYIAEYLDAELTEINVLEQQLISQRDELLAYRQSAITEYVTGQKLI